MALTPLEEALKEARKHYLEVDERRRLSDNKSDFTESFRATEDHVRIGVEAFLDHFGVDHDPGSTTNELIDQLRETVLRHPPQLTHDARPEYLVSWAIDDLEQVLKDIEYFRLGYGATDRPRPPDMKRNAVATLGSGPFNAFQTLLVSTKGTKPQRTDEKLNTQARLRREGKLSEPKEPDFVKFHARIVKELQKTQNVEDLMASVLRACRSQVRRKAWDAFSDLPYSEDVEKCAPLVLTTIAKEPPSCRLEGFLLLIENPYRDGDPVADLSVSGTDTYDPSDEWAEGEMKYEPLSGYAESDVLAAIYKLADETELGAMAGYPLELAYSAFLARACVLRYKEEADAGSVGVSAGFHDGDLIHLGRI